MADSFRFGSYYRGSSLIHRLDARIKFSLFIFVLFALLFVSSFLTLGIVAGCLVLLWLIARIPPKTALRALWPVIIFALFPLIMNSFFISEGTELIRLGFLRVTDVALRQGCFMSIRLVLIFSSAVLLTLTTTSLDLANGIGMMMAPLERFRFPAYEISLMLRIALSYIFDIGQEFLRIQKAQQARGALFNSGGPIRRIKALIPCLVPLFSQCFRNAENLGLAMESRCYHGGSNRSYYRQMKVAGRDIVAVCLVVLVMTAAIVTPLLLGQG
jgi:energy-coupling factor transport system permease protein